MSTRRLNDGSFFDHGAQYFTVRTEEFKRMLQPLIQNGDVAKWPAVDQAIVSFDAGTASVVSDSVQRWVGRPGMNQLCKSMIGKLKLKTNSKVVSVDFRDEAWLLFNDTGEQFGPYDAMVVSTPAAQTTQLLNGKTPLAQYAAAVTMQPCWAAMISLETQVTDQWVGAFLNNEVLSWAARNNTKPDRTSLVAANETSKCGDYLVLHAGADWTAKHWDEDPEVVGHQMLAQFWKITELSPVAYRKLDMHRWKFAIPKVSQGGGENITTGSLPGSAETTGDFGWDAERKLAVCGDWCCGGRVEGAYLSGLAAGKELAECD